MRPTFVEVYDQRDRKAKGYWYMIYTVTNSTPDNQLFVPEFLIYTDTGQVLRAGQRIPSAVYSAIKRRHNAPLLRDMTSMTATILRGRDNARRGVAIWPNFDPATGQFDVFIGGLSGETAEVSLPKPIKVPEKDISGKDRMVLKKVMVLTKTLQLTYSMIGEAAQRGRNPVEMVSKKWVMR